MMIMNTHLCKLLRHVKATHAFCFYFEKYPSLSSSLICCIRCISSKARDDQQSFIVSYLINNCGLSPKSALSAAAKYLHFKTPSGPDSVLSFFKSHEFPMTQITKIIVALPKIIQSNPEKTLLPKIQFFHSKGFSSPDIVRILSACPRIMLSSLENQLVPGFNFLQNILPSDDKVIYAIKRLPKIILPGYQQFAIANIKFLKDIGLPQSSIVWLLTYQPATLVTNLDQFTEIVEEVKRMGINPSLISFVIAILAKRSMSKSTCENKLDIYKKWGWSQEETLVVFGKCPWVMTFSEKKIMKMMDYYINKMGWSLRLLQKYPRLISYSLEKRVIPRCSVMQVLQSKGLRSPTSEANMLNMPEELFLRTFVTPYKEEAPHLLKLYQEKLNAAKREDIKTE